MDSEPRPSMHRTRETSLEGGLPARAINLLHKAAQQSLGAQAPILLGPAFLRGEIIGLSIEHQDSNKA